MMVQINYAAVFIAAIAGMAVGFVWYSPMLFGNAWRRIIGKDNLDKTELEEMQKDVKPYFVIMFVGTLVSAYVLATFIGWLGMTTAAGGLRVAFLAWLGFAIPMTLGDALFSGRDKSLIRQMLWIRIGHHLVGLLGMGAIIGAWT